MAINLIVLAVTLLMACFLGVWIFFPRLRAWMEMPKHRFLETRRRFPEAIRDLPETEEPSCRKEENSPDGSI